ncbi:hypothetical protein [Sphaerochaeta sp. PS]|uniref:hypothetical protein n=1 Tax=Sphaerochaeta sp. PS TaxID=3076336 RepID=UPI0028A524CA|nr:hypothetical protein [Sphaerochaeta sp. PS]MDT4761513.1 hypothetical protein [Sphaerochaeta sp. PS]
MKNKTTYILLSILLITLFLASCNMDASSGIFRQLADSKEPLSIRYQQLLGFNTAVDRLYFRTETGIYRVDSTRNSETMVTSKKDSIIQAASYVAADKIIFYLTNNQADAEENKIRTFLTTTPGTITTVTPTSTFITSNLSILNLYANSTVMISGTDGSSNKLFELIKYYTGSFGTSVAQFDSTLVPAGYDFAGVIQQTTKEQEAVSTNPVLVSFVESPESGTGNFKHYLVTTEGALPTLIGSNSIRIASFFYHDGTTIYVLTTDGKLYHVTTAGVWTLMQTSSLTYDTNAFAYPVDDGTNYHLVTKPLDKTAPLHVFSFAYGETTNATPTNVSTGYAKDLSLATIVSAQEIVANHLLVATYLNGMYEITIVPSTAGSNDGSGTTTAAEKYTF